jgi:hypothetical protein
MPAAVVCDVQYDWAARYDKNKVKGVHMLSGFLPSVHDPAAACAFKMEMDTNNECRVKWKPFHDSAWLGENHQPTSPGFCLLDRYQQNTPKVIEPNEDVMQQKYINQVVGPNMRSVADAHLQDQQEVDEAMDWLRVSCQTGSMPYTAIGPDVASPADWGRKVVIGTTANRGEFELMERVKDDAIVSFWELPTDLLAEHTDAQTAIVQALQTARTLPNVRYKSVKADDAKTIQRKAAEHAAGVESKDTHEKSDSALDTEMDFNTVDDTHAVEKSFACVHFESNTGGSGMQLVKITSLFTDAAGDRCLQGNIWGTMKKYTDSNSLKGSFNPDPNQPDAVTEKCWSVLAYFHKLHTTKQAKNKIPTNVKRQIVEQETKRGLILFSADSEQSNAEHEQDS